MEFTNIADMKDPASGKSYRDINESKVHNIPLRTLVETSIRDHDSSGLRMYVVSHDRDCDGTPLYGLSFKKDWKPSEDPTFGKMFSMQVDRGYSEETLTIVKKEHIMNIENIIKKWNLNISYADILDIWNEPHRHYHNVSHLNDLLDQIESAYEKGKFDTKMYEKLIMVALFHDIVYDPFSSANEESSADYFVKCCSGMNPDANDVMYAIIHTKNHTSQNLLSKLFNDFDMAILMKDYASLLKWEEGIYNEYKACGNAVYRIARVEFLKKMTIEYSQNSENMNRLISYVENHYK